MVGALIWIGVGLVALFVGWPLVQARRGAEPGDADALPLERQKREALAAIKEAEFDRAMGKLSDADFAQITQRYRDQALTAMAALDTAATTARRPGAVRMAFCPQCGTKLPPRANFCGSCGKALRSQAA
ncbi:MAG TPA: zinc ribbon domain-containing protein [Candidatus Dormibacteraeota bacterium]|nr:zinc ribbon domain-containing protein [Candidatus Dormibacteraeota bacterium]